MYAGKRVVILGPSESVLENTAQDIESYDVVVRINTGWPVPPERQPFIGQRADILYHNCTDKLKDTEAGPYSIKRLLSFHEDILKEQLKMVFIPVNATKYAKIFRDFCGANRIGAINIAPFFNKTRRWISMKDDPYCPTYGYIAVNHILSTKIKELYITGFSFYREKYYEGHSPTLLGNTHSVRYNGSWRDVSLDKMCHDPEKELRHFITKVYPANKHRLRLDKTLHKIIAMEKMI